MAEDIYRLDRYNFELPRSLIAQKPAKPRSSCRMMVLHSDGRIEHRIFRDIVEYLQKGDLLIMNDSKVIPARFFGKKPTGGKAEILLLRPVGNGRWEALCGGKRIREGMTIDVSGHGVKILRHIEQGKFIISLPEYMDENTFIKRYGNTPVPPYIKSIPKPEDYQTIYAKKEGSVAAPTAGLHFDEPLLKELRDMGVEIAFVTLHVGIGTFREVTAKDIRQHDMEKEYFEIPSETVDAYSRAVEDGRRIFAVGTTTIRTLESATAENGTIVRTSGWADVFIYPGYKWKTPLSGIVTNFHIPRSTLIMLVSAFAGYERIMNAYRIAIKEEYRFFSFGDAMLIFRPEGLGT